MVAFLANLSVVVLLLLDLSPVMNLMLAIPAIACSSTVACRCYVSLSTFARADAAETRGTTWTHGLAWFKRSFAQKRGDNDNDKHGHVSSVHWVHTVQDPDALEHGPVMAHDARSSTAVFASRPDDQRQEHSGGDIDLPELQYVSRPSHVFSRFESMADGWLIILAA